MHNDLLKSRISQLKHGTAEGSCVLYVMSRDQRFNDNHALIAAQQHAIAKQLPLAVVFCLQNKTGNRAKEHYSFMLDGLLRVEADLTKRRIPFMILIGDPKETLTATIHHTKPDAVYFDFNPLKGPRKLIEFITKNTDRHVYVVDTHNIIPVWATSEKSEFGAYTIRPKIHKLISHYLCEPDSIVKHPYEWPGPVKSMAELEPMIQKVLHAQKSNGTKLRIKAGEDEALLSLNMFISSNLASYYLDRNDPTKQVQSGLSPYLHFGHISSLRVALRMQQELLQIGEVPHLLYSSKIPKSEEKSPHVKLSIDALLEEMIVRKELADNFCFYNDDYDNINGAPHWARESLKVHSIDKRTYVYSYDQLAASLTHDPAWNAAQKQLTTSGKMRGYMRMYWAKKVLEWSETPEQAIKYLIELNDFYSIDGGDPNGYAGIMWSIAGVHDRAWNEREIFGKVRYMNYDGLKRKFDVNLWNGMYE